MTDDDHLKYRLIYRGFLQIFFSFLAVYSFLHWLLVLRLHLLDLTEEEAVWAPMFLAFIPIWIGLGDRIRLLQLKDAKKNYFFSVLLLAHLAIGFTTVAFQYYLINATGELRALKTPEEITRYRPVKYYTIDSYYVDKQQVKFKRFEYVSGKGNRKLTYEMVIAVPLYTRGNEPTLISPLVTGDTAAVVQADAVSPGNTMADAPIWVCMYYDTSLSNWRSSSREKELAWEQFEERCKQHFKNTDLYKFTCLDRPGKGDRYDQFVQTVTGLSYVDTSPLHLLQPRYGSIADGTYAQLGWTLLICILGASLWWLMIRNISFERAALDRFLYQQNP